MPPREVPMPTSGCAAVERAEQDVMKERALVRAAEKAAATTKKDYEVKMANLQAEIERVHCGG